MTGSTDTIVSVATPPGRGGVGIVRVSGELASSIAEAMLGSLPEPRRATLAAFGAADGQPIDEGLAIYFKGPQSFTGEDVLELHGHGGPVILAMVVDRAIELGARRAEPGEFSQRAFLNDKLDLAQAEAIADLIESGTEQAARAAVRSLSGAFSGAVLDLVAKLTALRVHVEAAIDFPEEEIDFLADEALVERLDDCSQTFADLLANATIGRVLRDGYQIVLVGEPNAGKSSLMNRLSGEDTAIVTEIAGTTRDVLRERIDIDGLAVELVDTAGLRDNPGVIEMEGIRRAKEAMANADAVLWVQDATLGRAERPELPEGVPVLVVRNKIDVAESRDDFDDHTIELSAKTGEGIDELRDRIRRLAGYRDLGEGAFTARQRHVEAIERAARSFATGRAALTESRAGELLAEELRLAQQALGEITGEVTSDDLLGEIFSSFCIGK